MFEALLRAKMLRFAIFSVLYTFGACAFIAQKCKQGDNKCLDSAATLTFQKMAAGNPDLGAKSLDPMYVDEIKGGGAGLWHTFRNCTLQGISHCTLNSVIFDLDKSKYHVHWVCPELNLHTADYELGGSIFNIERLAAKGKGEANIKSINYKFGIVGKLDKSKNSDGDTVAKIMDYKFQMVPDKLVFDFKNLENSEVLHKFANSNSKALAPFFDKNVFDPFMKQIVANINIHLNSVPYNNIWLK